MYKNAQKGRLDQFNNTMSHRGLQLLTINMFSVLFVISISNQWRGKDHLLRPVPQLKMLGEWAGGWVSIKN